MEAKAQAKDQQTKKSSMTTMTKFLERSQMIKTKRIEVRPWTEEEKKAIELETKPPEEQPLEDQPKSIKERNRTIKLFDNIDYLADAREQIRSGNTRSGNRFAHHNLKK